jgi:hypothetical protein
MLYLYQLVRTRVPLVHVYHIIALPWYQMVFNSFPARCTSWSACIQGSRFSAVWSFLRYYKPRNHFIIIFARTMVLVLWYHIMVPYYGTIGTCVRTMVRTNGTCGTKMVIRTTSFIFRLFVRTYQLVPRLPVTASRLKYNR